MTVTITDLRVVFDNVVALDGVDLEIGNGQVHGLLGHNGSGKSTLIKALAGVVAPDLGEIEINGHRMSFPISPHAARVHGLAFVHQGLGLATNLTVLDNIAVSRFDLNRAGKIQWRKQAVEVREQLARFGVDVPLSTLAEDLPPVQQAIVAIVRALNSVEGEVGTRLLVLDEPTVYLPQDQVEILFAAVRELVAGGDSVLFVSHRIDEVLRFTDRVTVLREGSKVASGHTGDLSERDIVRMITGRDIGTESHHAATASQAGEVTCTIRNLASSKISHAHLVMHRGEIVGVTGLAGSGFDELPYIMAGAVPGSGHAEFTGDVIDIADLSPRAAVKHGIVLIPADRQRYGVNGDVSILENVALPYLRSFFRGGILRDSLERDHARSVMSRMGVRYGELHDPIKSLSGGNQQKCVLGKWLARDPRLAVLHEPTQGVDIGGRFDIYDLLRRAAARGTAILVASESPEELAEISDRVLIFKSGRIVRELTGSRVEKHTIVDATIA